MSDYSIGPIRAGKSEANTQGAFLANNDEEKKPKFTIAFNTPGGYVSPPSSNIMGFGPAANQTESV